MLLQISLFQRSKANHNFSLWVVSKTGVVTNIIISKIESKSQHAMRLIFRHFCCYKYHYFKDRKQITTRPVTHSDFFSCYKYHYFKDRKQITTGILLALVVAVLLQISLFQRSKANHN